MGKSRGIAVLVALCLPGVSSSFAQTLDAGNINREIEKTLPSIRSEETVPLEAPAEKGQPFQDEAAGLPAQQELAQPIDKIFVFSPILEEEITALFDEELFDRQNVRSEDLARIRKQIWALGLKNKRLLYVDFHVGPNPNEPQKRWLTVEALEITLRHVIVEAVGDVRQAVLDDIREEAAREFYEEKVLDLDELEARIKARLILNDVTLRASLTPVDARHADLKIIVKETPTPTPSALIQLDNFGGWAFGRDRVMAGAALHGLMAGDQLDLLAMKTGDVGNGDYEDGMYFGRAEYMVPIGEWGVKFHAWMSGLHYHEVAANTTGANTNGEAFEEGQGFIRPVYLGASTAMDVRGDFYTRYLVDRVFETERTSEKVEYAGTLKTSLAHAPAADQLLQLSAGVTAGVVDLTGDRDAYEQDQAGPKANGVFAKIEGEGSWSGPLPLEDGDFRLGLLGQWAATNLDSSEEFSLGGVKGLRAFGSSEASGDMGVMLNGEIGYRILENVRPFMFYDIGATLRNVNAWEGASGPSSYVLQDAGVGIAISFDPVNFNLTFGHQIGRNPGLTSAGKDSDNTDQRFRVWASLSYRY